MGQKIKNILSFKPALKYNLTKFSMTSVIAPDFASSVTLIFLLFINLCLAVANSIKRTNRLTAGAQIVRVFSGYTGCCGGSCGCLYFHLYVL